MSTTLPFADTPHGSPENRRRRFYPASEIRINRQRRGLTLAEVAAAADMTLTRASIVERNPALGTPAEIAALQSAVRKLSGGEAA
jgi:hypothetical protein